MAALRGWLWRCRKHVESNKWPVISARRSLSAAHSRWSHRIDTEEYSAAGCEDEEIAEEYTVNEAGFQIYDGHIPTTCTQKTLLAIGSAFTALCDPKRHDMVATLGETTGHTALKWMHHRMKQDSTGREILRLKPRVNSATVNLDELRKLPDGMFGREYARFLDDRKLSQDSRTAVRFIDDQELAYVMQRYREIHDFTHTLLGLPTVSVVGEVAVKWFEMIQTGLPMCVLSSLFGSLNPSVTPRERMELRNHLIPWAVPAGYRAKFIMNVFYERHFEEPIDSLRQNLSITPAPKLKGW